MSRTTIPVSLRWLVWERDQFKCAHCGSRRYLTIDHVVSESAGGKTEESNLQTLCSSCNNSKGNRLKPSRCYSAASKLPIINIEFVVPHISVQDTARELERPRLAVYRMIERGDIVAIKLGGVLFIPNSEVERLKNEKAKETIPSA